MKSFEKSFVILEKSQFDESPFFSKTKTLQQGNLHPVKLHVKKQTSFYPKSSAVKQNKPLMPVYEFSSIKSAKKIYRVPVNRDKAATLDCTSDADDNLSRNEPTACVESSVTKPQPPSAVTLKYNSNVLLKPRRTPQTAAIRTRREKKNAKEKSLNEGVDRRRIYESNIQPTKVHNKQDILASLKQISLIEPFLGNTTNGFNSELQNSTKVQLPPHNTTANGVAGLSSNVTGSNKFSKPFQKDQELSGQQSSKPWKRSQVTNDTKVLNKKKETKQLTTEPNCPSPLSHSYDNDMLYIINGNAEFESSQEDYIDTSDNESFVYRDAYNNRISIKEKTSVKRRHETPISIVASLNESNKRQSYLTQRQLSFVGASLPTATVVDISTGSVVENGTISSATEGTQVEEQVQRLRSSAGSRTNVPVSFYHNRKIKRKKQEDRAEMLELGKLKEKARVDIKNMLNRVDSANSRGESRGIPEKTKPFTPEKKKIEYKIIRLPSPAQVEVKKVDSISNSSSDVERVVSPPSSIETTNSSSATVTKQPCTPNPSPQLASGRFQIFPTTNPNTFHAYTSSSAQPTVINMDHFCLARASLNEQENNQSKNKPSTGTSRRTTNGFGNRIPTSSDGRSNQQEVLKTDTLIKGQSINLKKQPKSDSDAVTDYEVETSDESAAKSSGEDSDDKKSLHFAPPHTANKFFKISNSAVALKTKKNKEETPEFVTYTPLQSLVIKSCQSVNPIVVIPESESTHLNDQNNTAPPPRTQTVDGHLSPLKGIRILRRKMTIKHYDGDLNPYNVSLGFNTLLHDAKHLKRFSLDQGIAKDYRVLDSDAKTKGNGRNAVTVPSIPTESLDHPRTSTYTKAGYLEGKVNAQQPNLVYQSPLNGRASDRSYSLVEKSINIDKLCLEKENASSFLLLKEGSMQSLNFINPNAIHFSLAPTSKQDVKDAAERSAKRRRKIQLGSGGGSGDCVSVKIAAGGGFKSNVARYSLLLRQKYHKQQEETAQKKIHEKEILEISKAGIEPLNKSDKRTQKIFESNSSRESNTLPSVVEGLNEDSSVENANNVLSSRSRLQIRDLLDNLCASTEPFEGDLPNDAKNSGQGNKINENDLENNRNHFNLSKSPSLNDLHANGRVSNSSFLPDTSTTAYRLTRDVSFNDERRRNGDVLDTSPKQDQQLLNGFVGRQIVFSRNENHSDATYSNASRLDKLPDTYVRENAGSNGPLNLPPQNRRGKNRYNYGGYTFPRGRSSGFSNSYPATIRMSKDPKPNWNQRMDDYGDSKIGYYESNGDEQAPEGNDFDVMNISPASSLTHQSRDQNGILCRSRFPGKYGILESNNAVSSRNSSYTNPLVGAPNSFQQRLIELSLLEADTVKYEKNRKIKRKSKQLEKDS